MDNTETNKDGSISFAEFKKINGDFLFPQTISQTTPPTTTQPTNIPQPILRASTHLTTEAECMIIGDDGLSFSCKGDATESVVVSFYLSFTPSAQVLWQ